MSARGHDPRKKHGHESERALRELNGRGYDRVRHGHVNGHALRKRRGHGCGPHGHGRHDHGLRARRGHDLHGLNGRERGRGHVSGLRHLPQ